MNSSIISCNLKILVKIPPNINEAYIDEIYILTSSPPTSLSLMSVKFSAKTARMITQKDEQFNLYNASPKPRFKS